MKSGVLLCTVALVIAGVLAAPAAAREDIQKALDAAYAKYKTLTEGKNADYIPALAKVDPDLSGIAVVTVDGKTFTAGDIKSEVSIQSISKVFTLARVIQESGAKAVVENVGVDATGRYSTPSKLSNNIRARR